MRRPALAETLRALPAPCQPLLQAVLAAADARELRVYLVGGPVRDLLLGRPVRDVDLIVESDGGLDAAGLADAADLPGARVIRHGRFGTVTLRGADADLDLATVRREHYAHDGALPSVEPGTLEEDLRRRDFSVNALALPLSRAARARHTGVVDGDEGCADLERKRLRVLHPRSFHDDPTRALRAARLAPRLGFSLSRGSRGALRDALRDGAFGRVSGDRLRREVVKLFEDAALGLDPPRALGLLAEWHVLGALEPGLELVRKSVAPLRRLGRQVADPPWPRGRWRPWVSGLSLWLAPLPPALRRRTLRRFAVRGAVAEAVAGFPAARDGWLRALVRARGRGAADAVLGALDDDALHALLACADAALRRRILRWAREDRGRRPPIGGAELVEIGLSGPAVGRALQRIRAAYLDGRVRSREEALALASELARKRSRIR
jgi:tRNA nucleotidyltransferase (CCA-adding enzyme)